MLILTERFREQELLEALADYHREEPDDEPPPNIWPLTVPDPGLDLSWWQAKLDRTGGHEGPLPRLRARWAGTLFVRVEGVKRLQYTLPFVAEAQVSFISVPQLDAAGCPVLDERGAAVSDVYHYLGDDAPAVDLAGRTDVVYGVKDYVVEQAVGLYCIQELVPGFHAARGRDDALYDATGGLYQLAHWCSSDSTENGEYRPVEQCDVDAVERGWKARAADLHHRPDEETPADYKRRRMRELIRARRAAERRRDESEREESKERLIQTLVERAGVPMSKRAWSLPNLVTPKRGHR